jgi:hypothetical protein
MFEVVVGPTFTAASMQAQDFLTRWWTVIERVSSLFARFDTRQAEIAATVHYATIELQVRLGRAPFASEVITAVEQWTTRRKPPVKQDKISQAIVSLATQEWIDVVPDESVEVILDELSLL